MLEECSPQCRVLRDAAHALAALDCLQSFAAVASDAEYCRPEIVDESVGVLRLLWSEMQRPS